MPDPMSEQQVEERWTIRICEECGGDSDGPMSSEAACKCDDPVSWRTVEVVPASTAESRVQELEGERDEARHQAEWFDGHLQHWKRLAANSRAIERERDDLRCFANRLIDLVQEMTALGCPGCAEGVPDHDCLHPKIDSVISAITERRTE